MSSQDLAAFAGIIVSLALSYIPGLAPRWDALTPEYKRLIMLGLLVVVAVASYALACVGWGAGLGLAVTCDKSGGISLVKAFAAAVITSQAAYMITPKPTYAKAK